MSFIGKYLLTAFVVLLLALSSGPSMAYDLISATQVADYQILAEQGDPKAMFNFGYYHFFERKGDRAQNQKIGITWVTAAAQKGYFEAQKFLGESYSSSQYGLERDIQKAAYWYARGAEQGDAACQAQLGIMYMHGRGVPLDLDIAEAWLKKGKKNGSWIAKDNLEFLPKHRRALSGTSTLYTTAQLFALLLAVLPQEVTNSAETMAGPSFATPSQASDYNECAKKAARDRIVYCYFLDGGCDSVGCSSKIVCDRGWKRYDCEGAIASRYESGNWYCDMKNPKNFSQDRNTVIQKICSQN